MTRSWQSSQIFFLIFSITILELIIHSMFLYNDGGQIISQKEKKNTVQKTEQFENKTQQRKSTLTK